MFLTFKFVYTPYHGIVLAVWGRPCHRIDRGHVLCQSRPRPRPPLHGRGKQLVAGEDAPCDSPCDIIKKQVYINLFFSPTPTLDTSQDTTRSVAVAERAGGRREKEVERR